MDAFRQPILALWSEAGDRSRFAGDWASGLTRAAGVAGSALAALAAVRREHPGRDALVLHAEAQLPADGWSRLATAWSATDAAVLSPLDTDSPAAVPAPRIPSPPWPGVDHSVPSDTWSPYCSLWRAEILSALPDPLDEMPTLSGCRRLPSLRIELPADVTGAAEATEDFAVTSARELALLVAQRDAAWAERDQLQARLDELLATTSWRITAPMRAVVTSIRHAAHAIAYRIAAARLLTGRALTSLRVRGVRGSWVRLRQRLQSHGAEPCVLQLPDPARPVRAADLVFPDLAAPRASVIVPVHNQLAMTLACLQSLAAESASSNFEVIVVDDASTDGTGVVLPTIRGLRNLHNPQNLGFIGACNAGATLARGEYLVFLNNDTYAQPGWLDALLATFAQHPDTGLAGSKLVYPDGRLQEAGGIVFRDASGWNYGRFGHPGDPRYNFVREADYCSGAAIAVPRALFTRLGGFDRHFAPAYYEDTDLAMRVRHAGLKVRYQPASVVVHHEGVTSGTDVRTGVKSYQVTNQRKFLERWQPLLAATHPAPGTPPALAADHRKRRRVLVLDACTPTPDRDSGSVRMLELMRLLLELDCSVCFINENQVHDGPYTTALQQLGIEVWWQPWTSGLPRWLAQYGKDLDLIIASRHYVLAPALPMLRAHAPQAQLVFDTVDLHFLREERAAELSGNASARQAATRTRVAELRLIDAADRTWVVSEVERQLLADLRPEAKVEVVSNIHRPQGAAQGFAARNGLVFVGGYRHPPNVDAALWLADDILPRIRARNPGIVLHLVGGDAPAAVRALAVREGINFHGHVADLDELLATCRMSVAPLRYGAGVKGKVNQALACGLPVVATSCAVEGMHLRDGVDVLVADDADAFAQSVLRLHDDAELWQTLSAGGVENTRRHFSPEAARPALAALLASLPPR
jgi:GT2 family glycosyltransferase/glycosyltransferase involved in cell wall biosynthesis